MTRRNLIIIIGVIALEALLILMLYLSYVDYFSADDQVQQQEEQTQDTQNQTQGEDIIDNTQAINEEAMARIKQEHLQNAPEVYLHNITPIERSSFVLSSYINEDRGEIVFSILPRISSLQQVQDDVLNFMREEGISDEQIGTLNIEYVNNGN